MEHSFNVNVAIKYGINQAIILNNIYYWVSKNKANNKHFYDGYYWTYNSKKAFAELFPYMNERQIGYSIEKLVKEGLIIKGNYNEIPYDKTCWYAVTSKGLSILQNCKMDITILSDGYYKNVNAIPNINTNNKTNNEKENKKEKGINDFINEAINYMNELGGTSFKPTTEKTRKNLTARYNEGFDIDEIKDVIFFKYKMWVEDEKEFSNGVLSSNYYRPDTLFGTKFESYLQEYKRQL